MMKKRKTSVTLTAMDKAKIDRIFNVGLTGFIRAALNTALDNQYIKNKILEAIKKEGVK